MTVPVPSEAVLLEPTWIVLLEAIAQLPEKLGAFVMNMVPLPIWVIVPVPEIDELKVLVKLLPRLRMMFLFFLRRWRYSFQKRSVNFFFVVVIGGGIAKTFDGVPVHLVELSITVGVAGGGAGYDFFDEDGVSADRAGFFEYFLADLVIVAERVAAIIDDGFAHNFISVRRHVLAVVIEFHIAGGSVGVAQILDIDASRRQHEHDCDWQDHRF